MVHVKEKGGGGRVLSETTERLQVRKRRSLGLLPSALRASVN